MKTKERLVWLDNLKAIGIVLIVFGHAPSVEGYLANIIYSFHVPLFFFASGCLFSEMKLSTLITKTIKKLFIPYLFFIFASWCYWVFANLYSPIQVSSYDIFSAFIFGSSVNNIYYFNPPLWFFPALISLQIMANILYKKCRSKIFIVSFIISIISMLLLNNNEYRLPWGVDVAFAMVGFYFMGFGFKLYNFSTVINDLSDLKRTLLVFILILILGLGTFYNGRVDVNTLKFSNCLLFYVTSSSGILLTMMLAVKIRTNNIMGFLSKNTIWFFPLHGFIFSGLTFVLMKIGGMDKSVKDTSIVYAFAYTLGAFIVISIIVKLKNKLGFKLF